jgi:hypothetical protein
MINVNEIIRSRETGSYYIGDIERDIDSVLSNVDVANSDVQAIKENQNEILAQLPDEDFLCDAIDRLTDCVTEKMNKADILEKIKIVRTMLEDIQQKQAYATEYAFSLKSD